MKKFVGKSASGKTRNLVDYAAENSCAIVCEHPGNLLMKAAQYGYHQLTIISYDDYWKNKDGYAKVVIDDIESFLKTFENIVGFSCTGD